MSYTLKLSVDPFRQQKQQSINPNLVPQNRILKTILDLLFVPYAFFVFPTLAILVGLMFLSVASQRKTKQNISVTDKSGSRTARHTLQARAHVYSFGYGVDSMAPSLFKAVNASTGTPVERFVMMMIYWITVGSFQVFQKDVYAMFLNVLKVGWNQLDTNTYHHLRTSWLDDVTETFILDEKDRERDEEPVQVVLLGAGFDSRAYGRLPSTRGAKVSFFEVDSSATQAVKRRALESLKVDTSNVRYISVDFEHENWLNKLCESSDFDINRRLVVVWEGVSMYLTPESVESTLKTFGQCASGSVIGFDFFMKDFISKKRIKSMTSRIGETFHSGLDHESLVSLAQGKCGLDIVEELGFKELLARYGPRKGDRKPGIQKWRDWARFALLRIP